MASASGRPRSAHQGLATSRMAPSPAGSSATSAVARETAASASRAAGFAATICVWARHPASHLPATRPRVASTAAPLAMGAAAHSTAARSAPMAQPAANGFMACVDRRPTFPPRRSHRRLRRRAGHACHRRRFLAHRPRHRHRRSLVRRRGRRLAFSPQRARRTQRSDENREAGPRWLQPFRLRLCGLCGLCGEKASYLPGPGSSSTRISPCSKGSTCRRLLATSS